MDETHQPKVLAKSEPVPSGISCARTEPRKKGFITEKEMELIMNEV